MARKLPAIILISLIVIIGIVLITPSSTKPQQFADTSPTHTNPPEEPGKTGTPSGTPGTPAPLPVASGTEEEPPEQPGGDIEDPPTVQAGSLTVHFIDVGQGDSILIQAPTKTVLIDGGPISAGKTVVAYLRQQGVESLDLVISTHPHEDHIGGLIEVLKNFRTKKIIDPAVAHTTKTFENYIDFIDSKSIQFVEAKPGIIEDLGGGASLVIIAPHSPSTNDLDNASVVARLTFGDVSFLLAGDANEKSEKAMLGAKYTLKSTVLKVGHHGSEGATSKSFLDKVKPQYAVISCGAGNSYDHPRQVTLDKLKTAKASVYRTDTNGNIVMKTDGIALTVLAARSVAEKITFAGADPEPEPEPKPDPKPEPKPPSKGQFVGSTKSDKYHRPTCQHAKKILPENEIWFKDAKEAQAAGYVPCKVCKPPH